MFLADAVAGYVETLDERGFDAPFIALLRTLGYTDVHFTHGPLEFGKDFIARRNMDGVEHQYCFQSKAGDLGLGGWREVRGQMDSMRYGTVVHPAFDPSLPRRLILVVTGRLSGNALVEFQDYNTHLVANGAEPAELWDVDELVPQLVEILIAGVPVRERARTVEMWGRLSSGEGSWSELRAYTRRWFRPELTDKERWEQTLTGSMLAHEATRAGREDLATCLAALLIRREWENPPPGGTNAAGAALTTARDILRLHAESVWTQVRHVAPADLVLGEPSLDLVVTHPVRAARLGEILSLLGLQLRSTNPDEATAIADWLEAWLAVDPAVAHLVSDDYATSLLVTSTFLGTMQRTTCAQELLRTAAAWLFDRIDNGLGIAPVGATADETVRRLLGPAYEHVRLSPNRTCYAAVVLADLALLLQFNGLYTDLCNDLWALDVLPTLVLPIGATEAQLIARVEYPKDGSAAPEHHQADFGPIPAASAGELFDCIAGWTTLRDRHLPSVLAALLTQ